MIEILQFIFSSFWIWLGCLLMLYVGGWLIVALFGTIIATARGDKVTIKAKMFEPEYSSEAENTEDAEDAADK